MNHMKTYVQENENFDENMKMKTYGTRKFMASKMHCNSFCDSKMTTESRFEP